MDKNICIVCGQPIATHRIVNWRGIAHTVSPDGRRCSVEDSERLHFAGQIDALRTIIRSLRWRAGRLHTLQQRWYASDLIGYSEHWQQRLDRYTAILREYYPRKTSDEA